MAQPTPEMAFHQAPTGDASRFRDSLGGGTLPSGTNGFGEGHGESSSFNGESQEKDRSWMEERASPVPSPIHCLWNSLHGSCPFHQPQEKHNVRATICLAVFCCFSLRLVKASKSKKGETMHCSQKEVQASELCCCFDPFVQKTVVCCPIMPRK